MNGKLFLSRCASIALLSAAILLALLFSSPRNVQVETYESNADLTRSLQAGPTLNFGKDHSGTLTINVDPLVRYQEIDGFGASLTDCSTWLINNLDDERRKDLMVKLFDPQKGIGLSFLRQPIGACDFVVESYSYDDMPKGKTDPGLEYFSIDKDRRYIIPLLREARHLNPRLKVMGTPWSPPGWMKTSDSMIEGSLKPSSYGPYANYLVKFVRAYEAAGIPVYAITPQNEPLYIPDYYPGMGMSPEEEALFISEYLGPAFRDAGLKTKIMVFDHNWETLGYPITVLSDPKAAPFAAGTSIHCYGGEVTAQTKLHNLFPQKDIWMTECSYETMPLDENVEASLRDGTELVVDVLRNWSRVVVLWNMVLDPNDRHRLCATGTNAGVVKIDSEPDLSTVSLTADYTALGHVSKFVVPGAHRIASNSFGRGSLEDVAFRNPDGSIVLLAFNSGKDTATFNVHFAGTYFVYSLPAGSAITFRWKP